MTKKRRRSIKRVWGYDNSWQQWHSIETALTEAEDPGREVAVGVAVADILVPDIANPLPMVLNVVQDEEDGAGWAAGVAGWPWKNVDPP
jgi:hypothetical protein